LFLEYYKLTEQPFGVTPNPRFLFLTPTHREAISSIVYGMMENRGFSALIAPPGMGKTTLLFELLQRCGDSVRTVFLFQFQPSPEGLMRNLLSELGVPIDESSFEEMQEKLNQLILDESKKGKRIVVVVDEAQNFREPVLEVLRMLSNFETNREKLIHIVLSGQPQLAEMLFSPAIDQLRQRISIMAVLRPLNAEETKKYIEHRLRVAGYRGTRPIFTTEACDRIAQYSGGIPRNINNLCFNSMSLGYALKKPTIDPGVVDEVYRDLNLESSSEVSTMDVPSASSNAWQRPASSMSAMWAPPRTAPTPGKGLGFSLGLISFAAVLCVGGVVARQYAISANSANVSLRTPAPPVPQVEIAAPSATPAEAQPELQTETQPEPKSEPELEPKPEPKPESDAKVIQSEPLRVAASTKQQRGQRGRPTPEPEQVRVKLLRVSRRESLYELCANNFGVCDGKAIYEIQRLNPRLRNSTQVEAGEAIRLPLDAPWKSRFSRGSKTSFGSK